MPAALAGSSVCLAWTAAPVNPLSCGLKIPAAVWMSSPLLVVSSDRPTSTDVYSIIVSCGLKIPAAVWMSSPCIHG